MISQNTLIEIFHLILDLTLTTAALESSASDEENEKNRALFNSVLRNENGVSYNLWDSPTLFPLLKNFTKVNFSFFWKRDLFC